MKTKVYKWTMAHLILFLFLCSFSSYAVGADQPPAGLTALAGNGEATLSWNAVSGATSYVLYRGSASGGPYTFVAQTQGVGYRDRWLGNGTAYTYYYVVTALNDAGQSPYSAQVSVTPTTDVLPAPTAVTARPGNGQVSLAWNAVQSAVSYNVYRAVSKGGPYTLLSPSASGAGFTDTGLTNGTEYFYVVQTTSTNPGAYSDEVNVTPSALLPVAPATLTVTPGSKWARLSWSASPGATGYAVYRGTSPGGPYSFAAQPNTTTYEDLYFALQNGTTYYYVVAAVNDNGSGAFSVERNAALSTTEMPHAVVLSATPGDREVSLRWYNPPGAVSYVVYRATSAGGPYTNLGVQIGNYIDYGLTNGTTYYYVVDSNNASPTITRSNEVSVTPTLQVPAPTNVSALAGNTEVTVKWDPVVAPSGYTESNAYYVYKATTRGGPYSYIGGSSNPHYTVTGLTNGQTYYFVVTTYFKYGYATSAYSAEAGAAPSATLPLAPTWLNIRVGNTQLSVTWSPVSGATGYKVYRRTDGSAWSLVGSPAGALFNDSGLTNGTKYYYAVAAVNAGGTGAWWSETDGTPSADHVFAPANVTVVAGNTQATVTWDPVFGASGYTLYKATTPGGPYDYSPASASSPYYTYTGLTNGRTYYFIVYADSAYSAEVGATMSVSLPLAPTGLSIISGNTQLSLTWTPVSGATGYKVYRRTAGGAWSLAGSPAGALFNDSGLINGTKYYYAVAAVNAGGTGAWSSETNGTPDAYHLLAPANVAAVADNAQAMVTWNTVVGASGYAVYKSTTPGGPYTYVASPSSAYYTFTGLTNGQTYYFVVITYSNQGSAYSSEVSAMPSSTPVNGACGSSNGLTLTSSPTTNLCTAGTATAVTGSGPWTWSCLGGSGGITATCSASKQTVPPVANDLTGDGKADILWHNKSTGDVYLWTMNGGVHTGTANIGNVSDTDWEPIGMGDFNGDGKNDILWHNKVTGEVYIWYMDGVLADKGGVSIETVSDLNWEPVGVGDFNKDGNPDILWYNLATGDIYLWTMTGAVHTGTVNIGNVSDINWTPVGLGDYNGDGNQDILWHNNSTGEVYLWLMTGATHTAGISVATVTDTDWVPAGTGDYNGDGKPDILWQNRTTGEVYIWYMNGSTHTGDYSVEKVPDTNWEIAGDQSEDSGPQMSIMDINGDGKPDIVWHNPDNGEVFRWNLSGALHNSTATIETAISSEWEIAGNGDFNGDGKADILWLNRITGEVFVWYMNGSAHTGSASIEKGVPTEWKITGVGDFNGDGKADILWLNRITGEVYVWYMNGSSHTGSASIEKGVPIAWKITGVGDFNGDGKADILWRNRNTGEVYVWYMDRAVHTGSASLGN